jgi:hypothetical protein
MVRTVGLNLTRNIYAFLCDFSSGSEVSCALPKALTERQPLTEKKAQRARPMSGKVVIAALCVTSFLVGLLIGGRTTLLAPPSSAASSHGSGVPLFAECDQMPVSTYAHIAKFSWNFIYWATSQQPVHP